MKSLVYLFTLVSLVAFVAIMINRNNVNNKEDDYGCKLAAEKDECCWLNNDGCCEPPKMNEACSQEFVTCCKKRKCIIGNLFCTYEYSRNETDLY